MRSHALDISYDGGLAPREREGAREGGCKGGRVESELMASELIHPPPPPPSLRRECGSVILFAERESEGRRREAEREECQPAAERMGDGESEAAQQ